LPLKGMLGYKLRIFRTAALISVLFFSLPAPVWSSLVRVCIWKGTYIPSDLSRYRGKYRGTLAVERVGRSCYIVNTLDLEDYLYGVLAKEMEKNWPLEALKAQAVCSRTMALFHIRSSLEKGLPWDVSDGVLHQVYAGIAGESDRVIEAVDATAGEYLVNGETLVPAFFHSCCGGYTSSAAEVWKSPFVCLVGVRDPYCEGSSYYAWSKTIPSSSLSKVLGIGVETVSVTSRDSAGRAVMVEARSSTGRKRIQGKDLRLSFPGIFTAPRVIPSTRFEVSSTAKGFLFKGTGYGHGVGLCQWGAKKMAEEGALYQEILQHYFPMLSLYREAE